MLPSGYSECIFQMMFIHGLKKVILSSGDLRLWSVTLTFKLDVDNVKMNQRAEY